MRKLSGDARKSPRYSGPRRFRMASSHRRRKKARIPPSGRNANVRTWMSPRSAPEQNSGARALPSDARHGFHGDVQEEGPEGFGPGVAVQDAHGDAGRGPPDPRCARVANESATRHIPPKAPPSRARTTHDRTRAVEERATCCIRHEHDVTTETPDRRTLTTDPPPTALPHVPRRDRHPARGEGCPEIHQGLR